MLNNRVKSLPHAKKLLLLFGEMSYVPSPPPPPPLPRFILLEDDFFVLLENGGKIILES